MSIYDEHKSLPSIPKFSFDYSKLKYPVIAAIIVLVIAFLIVNSSFLFKPDPLMVSFEKPSFDLTERNSLLMKVVVFNVLDEKAVDSVLTVAPVDKDALTVFPAEVPIPVLGKGEIRKFNFNLRPISKNIVSGNYEFNIKLVSNENVFEKRVSIYIKND